ncbi:MAG: LON peptidase substrate-binding domain-containing protein [Gordonia sp. (in: high G+C Gram-positive bacteria)]
MTVMPMFPLQSVLLPGAPLTLHLFEPRYRALLRDCLDDDHRFGVVLIERGSEVGGGDVRTDVGTVAQIVAHRKAPGRGALIGCTGAERIRVTRWLPDDPYPLADVEPWPDEPVDAPVWQAALRRAEAPLAEYWKIYCEAVFRDTASYPVPQDHRDVFGPDADVSPADFTFGKAAVLPIGAADKFRVLTAADPVSRVDVLIRALYEALPAFRLRMLGAEGQW